MPIWTDTASVMVKLTYVKAIALIPAGTPIGVLADGVNYTVIAENGGASLGASSAEFQDASRLQINQSDDNDATDGDIAFLRTSGWTDDAGVAQPADAVYVNSAALALAADLPAGHVLAIMEIVNAVDSRDYAPIRGAIHVTVTTANLPDAAIAASGALGDAAREVARCGIDYDAISANQQADVKRAAELLAAARLAGIAEQALTTMGNNRQGVSWSRPAFDASKRAAELRAEAAAIIAAVKRALKTSSGAVSFFAVGRGRRGHHP